MRLSTWMGSNPRLVTSRIVLLNGRTMTSISSGSTVKWAKAQHLLLEPGYELGDGEADFLTAGGGHHSRS